MRKGGREVKRRLKEEWATYCKMHAHIVPVLDSVQEQLFHVGSILVHL